MRTRTRWSSVVLAAAAGVMLTLAVPASAAPPDNPFVGSWESVNTFAPEVGPEEIHFAVGGNGHIQGQASVSAACFFALGEPDIRNSFSGTLEVVSEDPYIMAGEANVYCYPRGAGGRQLVVEGFPLLFQYDAATDTLRGPAGCAWRSGSSGAVCAD